MIKTTEKEAPIQTPPPGPPVNGGKRKAKPLLIGIIAVGSALLIGLLSFAPALALGPVFEHYTLAAGPR